MPLRIHTPRLAHTAGALVALGFLVYIAVWVNNFKNNIFREHAGNTYTQQEVQDLHKAGDRREAVVPRIIHQIFHNWTDPENENIPSDWDETRQTCKDLHPDWENRVGGLRNHRLHQESLT